MHLGKSPSIDAYLPRPPPVEDVVLCLDDWMVLVGSVVGCDLVVVVVVVGGCCWGW